ncbi:Toll-like protein, partial [Euroglyphus maynei]
TDRSQASVTKETLVRLDNNPINCDCHLFSFLNYTKSVGRLYGKHFDTINRKVLFMIDANPKITCHSPENLINRPLDNLKLSELICPIDDERICPEECECNYRSSDRSSIIDCDNRNIHIIPAEINLSKHQNISLKDTSIIPSVQGVIFQLRENHIQSVDNLDTMIMWNENGISDNNKPFYVEILLDKNNISKISWNPLTNDTIDSMVLVKKLSLQNNNMKRIPLSLLENFDKLVKTNQMRRMPRTIKPRLFLGNNPIDCYNEPLPPGSDCYIRDFKQWLSSHPSLIVDVNMIKCDRETIDTNSSSLVIVNMSDEHLCPVLIPPTSNTALMALSIVCVILASSLFVVSVLYYRNKQTILAFIYIHLNPIFICLNFTEDDLDEEKIYDAFVSYSSLDRDVVMELIEKLEKPHDMNEVSLILQNGLSIHEGKADQVVPENVFKKSATLKSSTKSSMDVENGTETNSYRLCIHERDWLPGNLISWNIVNSVQNSKRTILILSESFIRSIWFQVEFHTAYYQMLEDKMDRLIVIVRGNLPPKEELDKDLNFLLTTKTYLVWGEKWFWEKLYYAMPHKKRRPILVKDQTEKDKLTAVISPSNTIKYNGSTLNGRLNGLNDNWSSPTKTNPKAEAMKQYVDNTIASHFQLNSYSPNKSSIIPDQHYHHNHNNKQAASPVVNGNSSSTLTTTTPNSNNNNNNRPAPKSLRNSGTLSTATPNTLKEFNNSSNNNSGIDNKSFIDETNT